ncbi:MAG: acyl-ACP--UDP-N-acetylglucosamine O-acyltransferase [Puniceicoccales bacterium]|jgi:UDP-N-acetylglucosamine acyltransferase|nr:acyl-ACP--UDP-N-acetylglucosamine O-acyltransferase [Puniceicoccales bacterium]
MIHETAIIGQGVRLGGNVSIGAYSVLEDGVGVGDGVKIGSHVVLRSGSVIQDRGTVDSFAVIGGDPQDLSFDCARKSGVIIGHDSVIREHVTVHRATIEGSNTAVGPHCLLMAGSHVGHDCVLGSAAVLANCALLGGFVNIGDHCFIGGGASLHQRVRVGEYAILGGYSASSLDLPPYTMAADRSRVIGLNLVGLRRAGFNGATVAELKECFAAMYGSLGEYRKRAQAMLLSGKFNSPAAKKFLEFFIEPTQRGIAPRRNKIKRSR